MNITNDKVTDFLDSYYKPFDKDLGDLRLENEANNVPLILKETEGILRILLEQLQPKNILELGTAYGYSALFFAKVLPEASITTIDRGPMMIPIAQNNFDSRIEGERINFLKGDAIEQLDLLIESQESNITNGTNKSEGFDFVFIDAGKSHYQDFFIRAEKLCNPGAFIVCDNILMRGWVVDRSYEGGKRHRTNIKYMKQFLNYINDREDLTVSMLSSGDGLALIKLNDK